MNRMGIREAEPKKARGQVKRIKRVDKPQVGKTVVVGYLTEHSLFKAGDGWQVWEANLDSGSGQRKKKAERRRHSGPPPAVARVLGTVQPNQL